MKIKQSVLAVCLTAMLTGCGGGDGYYEKKESNNNNDTTTLPDLNLAQANLDMLKREGQFLFGNYNPNDAGSAKGYIDHALDTFAQGPLKIAVDTKKLFDKDRSDFKYYPVCFTAEGNQIYENTPCFVLEGEEKIKSALNKISPGTYNSWDFKITADQLNSLKITPDQVAQYVGETYLIIFDNQNKDKAFNDIWIAGNFGYPYKQSWGLIQENQLRIVSMNGEGEFGITVNSVDTTQEPKSYGALSIYKDPTAQNNDELYILQNNSSFDILINDNPNTPNIEPVSFVINSVIGDPQALATYRIKSNLDKILSIPSLSAVSGTRIENETPDTNAKEFNANIYLEGQRIFDFKNASNGSILKFKHIFNNTTFEGQSTNNNGTVSTTLTSPSNIKF